MTIEALVRGEVMSRAEVPDEYLELPLQGWQRGAEFREEVVRLQLMQFRQKIESYFKPDVRVEYCLVFRSKPDEYDESEGIATNQGRHSHPDAGAAARDPADAGEGNSQRGGKVSDQDSSDPGR
jgi:hypothetical protein